jgi:hypothetical protein
MPRTGDTCQVGDPAETVAKAHAALAQTPNVARVVHISRGPISPSLDPQRVYFAAPERCREVAFRDEMGLRRPRFQCCYRPATGSWQRVRAFMRVTQSEKGSAS